MKFVIQPGMSIGTAFIRSEITIVDKRGKKRAGFLVICECGKEMKRARNNIISPLSRGSGLYCLKCASKRRKIKHVNGVATEVPMPQPDTRPTGDNPRYWNPKDLKVINDWGYAPEAINPNLRNG